MCHKVQRGPSSSPGTPLKVSMRWLFTFSSHSSLPPLRIAGLCKDYCGVLNEEAIRLNFVLIYELLDEVLVSISLAVLLPPPLI